MGFYIEMASREGKKNKKLSKEKSVEKKVSKIRKESSSREKEKKNTKEVPSKEKKVCEVELYLDYKDLDRNFRKKIEEKLEDLVGKCTEKDGYIMGIEKYNIVSSFLNSNHVPFFKIRYTASVIRPQVGQIHKAVVDMVFDMGIRLSVKEKFQILVTVSDLKNYTFVDGIYESASHTIEKGMKLRVKISSVKYEHEKFWCFGLLV